MNIAFFAIFETCKENKREISEITEGIIVSLDGMTVDRCDPGMTSLWRDLII